MLQVAGVTRCQLFKASRRRQCPFRLWRHLAGVDIVMQKPDMIRPAIGQRPIKRRMNDGGATGRVGHPRINIIDGSGGQHDLRFDKQSRHIGIVPETVMHRHHGIGIGAFPGGELIIGRHIR